MPNKRFKKFDGSRRDISGAGIYGNAIRWIAAAATALNRKNCIELVAHLYAVDPRRVEVHVDMVQAGHLLPVRTPAQSRAANA